MSNIFAIAVNAICLTRSLVMFMCLAISSKEEPPRSAISNEHVSFISCICIVRDINFIDPLFVTVINKWCLHPTHGQGLLFPHSPLVFGLLWSVFSATSFLLVLIVCCFPYIFFKRRLYFSFWILFVVLTLYCKLPCRVFREALSSVSHTSGSVPQQSGS